jgi:predicted nucleotidyltransferase
LKRFGEKMDIERLLKKRVPEIVCAFPAIRVIYLFGSYASGKYKAGSDVDIAVFTDGSESPFMELELGAFLERRIGRPVDILTMRKVSPLIQHEVLSNKILLYETDLAERAFLEARVLRDYVDARHYQKKRVLWRKADGKHCDAQAAFE